ncbi:NADH-quinone oxidoreductase subunit NuoH [Lyticum sinuosum]|uniref:NADH-quinone oxidoreductase subunit H n=1 Tax=Lyticum sinuosum TaxID=1332059 RepID=A0AAE4VJI4_9RICK|nr:NADH-quinone oxidoreductase subunit NuoH [Lyticum sinuosum]MDZ5760971.1 NADH-quinone oxidoreductase subunit H [Lyticum sinuosum]
MEISQIYNCLIKIIFLIIPLILSVAYLTFFERKIIGAMQLRKGPNVTGPYGLLQPIADALKLIFKEIIIPEKADVKLFLAAPVITFITALGGWAVIPITSEFVISDINIGLLYLIAISSIGVYGIIIAGWSSQSIYAFLGSIRSAAQMISYEIVIGLCLLSVITVHQSINLREIVINHASITWHSQILLIPVSIIFFIAILAETNRHPFDIPEAESELVAGYHVEYSSTLFAMFFLGEYANMIIMSALLVLCFFGGWMPPFNINFLHIIPDFIWFFSKVSIIIFMFIWIRASLPRYRYDQLMSLGWKKLLPISFILFIIIAITERINY